MNNKSILKNIGISMLAKPFSMVLQLIYTSLALAFLGDAKYGVWVIILNIVSWINYFDIGIGNGLRNRLAVSFSKDEKETSQILVSTAYGATFVVSFVFCVLIISLWKLLRLSDFFKLRIDGENVNTILAISVMFVCINFVLSLSRTVFYAIQKPGVISIVGVIGQLCQVTVIWLISHNMKNSLLLVAAMYGFVSMIDNLILSCVIRRKYPYLVPNIKSFNVQYLKPLMTLGLGFFIMQICTLILNTTDNLLISNLFGAETVTPYSMVYKVFYMFVQVHAIIIMPMWSAYTAASAQNNIEWIKKTLRKINFVTLLLSLGVIVGIFLFEPFAHIWLGKKLYYGENLILITALFMIVQMISNSYSSFLCGVGEIRISVILAAIGATINIPLSILFAKKFEMGLVGIVIGSLTVMLLNVIILPVVTHKWLKKRA